MDGLMYEFKAGYQTKRRKLAKNVNIWVKSFPFCSSEKNYDSRKHNNHKDLRQ
jgi:hypothetical protein